MYDVRPLLTMSFWPILIADVIQSMIIFIPENIHKNQNTQGQENKDFRLTLNLYDSNFKDSVTLAISTRHGLHVHVLKNIDTYVIRIMLLRPVCV